MIPASATRALCCGSRPTALKSIVPNRLTAAVAAAALPVPTASSHPSTCTLAQRFSLFRTRACCFKSHTAASARGSLCQHLLTHRSALSGSPRIHAPGPRHHSHARVTSAPSAMPEAGPEANVAAGVTAAAAAAAAGPGEALWRDISHVYDKAQASGACSKTDAQVELFSDAVTGVDFVLRVATALKAKPQGPPARQEEQQAGGGGAAAAAEQQPAAAPPPPWRNPFLPPEPDLFVRQLGPDHNLLLNKFNVVGHHTIVTTKEFRSQAEPLYGNDLAAALEVVRCMPEGGLAFYNCGPHSGRSQPHKHLQVVPLPFTDGQPPLTPVHGVVMDAAAQAPTAGGGGAGALPAVLQPFAVRQLPYRCYAALLPESPTPEQLESTFNALLQLCFPGFTYTPPPQLAHGPPRDAAAAAAAAGGSVSYNVLLTPTWLMLVPRSAERCGPLALNSLAFAGTMLVRSEDELQYVRQKGPGNILARVGEPW